MSFREEVIVAHPPSQNEPLKSPLRLGLTCYHKNKKKNRNRNCYKNRVKIVYESNLFLRKMNHLLVLIPTPSQLTYKRINRFHLKLSNLKKYLTIITPITYQMKITQNIRMFLLMESQKKNHLKQTYQKLFSKNLADPFVQNGKRHCLGCIMIQIKMLRFVIHV